MGTGAKTSARRGPWCGWGHPRRLPARNRPLAVPRWYFPTCVSRLSVRRIVLVSVLAPVPVLHCNCLNWIGLVSVLAPVLVLIFNLQVFQGSQAVHSYTVQSRRGSPPDPQGTEHNIIMLAIEQQAQALRSLSSRPLRVMYVAKAQGRLMVFHGTRSKVRIRSVASPMGRRYIQFSDGVLQSRLTLRVAVCD